MRYKVLLPYNSEDTKLQKRDIIEVLSFRSRSSMSSQIEVWNVSNPSETWEDCIDIEFLLNFCERIQASEQLINQQPIT